MKIEKIFKKIKKSKQVKNMDRRPYKPRNRRMDKPNPRRNPKDRGEQKKNRTRPYPHRIR